MEQKFPWNWSNEIVTTFWWINYRLTSFERPYFLPPPLNIFSKWSRLPLLIIPLFRPIPILDSNLRKWRSTKLKKIDRIIVNYHHHYCSRRKIKFQASLHKDKSKSNLHPRSIYINLHANERKRCVLEHRVQLTNNSPRKRHNVPLSPLFSNSINHFLPTRYISKRGRLSISTQDDRPNNNPPVASVERRRSSASLPPSSLEDEIPTGRGRNAEDVTDHRDWKRYFIPGLASRSSLAC